MSNQEIEEKETLLANVEDDNVVRPAAPTRKRILMQGLASVLVWVIAAQLFSNVFSSMYRRLGWGGSQTITSTSPLLEVFEVYPPVRIPQNRTEFTFPVALENQPSIDVARTRTEACRVQLMYHVFGFSYGKPFVGEYSI